MELALFDTNVIIDYTKKNLAALAELTYYEDGAISAITWMEAGCTMTPQQLAVFESSLADAHIKVIPVSDFIMRRARARRYDALKAQKAGTGRKVPLPDCIIGATAEIERRLLVTCNAADFKGVELRVPYINTNGVITNVQPPPV